MRTLDFVLSIVTFWTALLARTEDFSQLYHAQNWVLAISAAVVVVVMNGIVKTYRTDLRTFSAEIFKPVAIGILAGSMSIVSSNFLLNWNLPRSVPFLFFIFGSLMLVCMRLMIRSYMKTKSGVSSPRKIAIIGCNDDGLGLGNLLKTDRTRSLVAFVDLDPRLIGSITMGAHVLSPTEVIKQLRDSKYDEVWVTSAMANLPQISEIELVCAKKSVKMSVFKSVNASALLLNKLAVSDLEPSLESLLQRPAVDLDIADVNFYRNKNILVTGGGGTIGSRICKELPLFSPKVVVALDISEFNLYALAESSTELGDRLILKLGSAADINCLSKIMNEHSIDVIIHAAAYKHVSIVEANSFEGFKNNILATQATCYLARERKISSYVLVSSDKAVRSTNVMGASKRVSEILVQNFAKASDVTKFLSVRFGNVLGSSGSVVPRFLNQIERGGPVTVTHPNVKRFFMTIPEAAQLVIAAGAMDLNGKIAVLEMGEPISILDLAIKLIRLSGAEPQLTEKPPTSSPVIQIKYTGLAVGEKMLEELSHSGSLDQTRNPKISTELNAESGPDVDWIKMISEFDQNPDRAFVEEELRRFLISSLLIVNEA